MFSDPCTLFPERLVGSSVPHALAVNSWQRVAVCRGIRLRLPLLCGHLRAVGRKAKLKEFSYG